MRKYLNLGCGDRFHPAWTNINFTSSGEDVIVHNLTRGIPLPNTSCEVVYHSHLLEHFPKNQAESFLRECYRVLVKGGIIRIVVPDLEFIAKAYLRALNLAAEGSAEWDAHYDWLLLEMYDQTVRNYSGGAMAEYLMQEQVVNENYIISRCGSEALKFRAIAQRKHKNPSSNEKRASTASERKPTNISDYVKNFPLRLRERWIRCLLGTEYEALEIGRFRVSGEIHQWMYDRYSLKRILEKCGFIDVLQRTATESYVPNWSSFNLDTEPDGSIYKPDSLYMEAIKP
jgi:predicted SAM-dependent methyltransferase